MSDSKDLINVKTNESKTIEYKDYNTTIDKVAETLTKYGVAVIPNVLDSKKCLEISTEIWKELHYVTNGHFNPGDQKTWGEYYNYLVPLHGMLLQHHSLGQMEPIWQIREDPKVMDVFAKIWNCHPDKLITSFDGLSVSLPHEITNRGYYRGKQWMHTDQSSRKTVYRPVHCVQGYVSLYDVNEGDASLTVYEGSHLVHEKFFRDKGIDQKDDWYKLTETDYTYFGNLGYKPIRVKSTAGSLVLWDSRTFHQGGEPLKDRKNPNYRMVVYVCMMPRDGISTTIMNKRIKAFEELRVTNHWPNAPKLFPKLPRTYGNEMPKVLPIHKPMLNNVRKRLIGYPIANDSKMKIKIVKTAKTDKTDKI